MNVLNMFEDRVGAIFGASAEGYTAPFSFKKLAKRAAHEMENETYVINGVDTAPALFTVLVSSDDDAAMRPLYAKLTSETSQFITSQAEKRGYVFVGEPLVRFVPDPSLKSGKFSVFAENVDARTLNRLRDEESAYYGRSSKKPQAQPQPQPVSAPPRTERRGAEPVVPAGFASSVPAPDSAYDDSSAGLDVLPSDLGEELSSATPRPAAARTHEPRWADEPLSEGIPVAGAAAVAATPHATPLVNPRRASSAYASSGSYTATPEPEPAQATPIQHQQASDTCLLIDRQSGRTYTASSPRTILGRERTNHGIVLHDPNVSRRHAELSFDGRDWHITDLNSTNGTLVNDVDIDECILRNGDLITVGLVNLEFREG